MGRIIILPEELEVIKKELEGIRRILKQENKHVEDPIFTTDEVMKLLKVSRRTLQNWRDNGIIKFSAIQGKFYYRMTAIDEMLSKNIVEVDNGND